MNAAAGVAPPAAPTALAREHTLFDLAARQFGELLPRLDAVSADVD